MRRASRRSHSWISLLRHYAVYRRILVTFVLVTAVTITSLTAVLYVAFTRRMETEVSRLSAQVLQEIATLSDDIHNDIRYLGAQLVGDQRVLNTLYAREIDRLDEFTTNLHLGQVSTVYPWIRFISIYNANTDRYVNTEGLTADDERQVIDRFRASIGTIANEYVARRIDLRSDEAADSPVPVISFVFYPAVLGSELPESFLLLNIDAAAVGDIISDRQPFKGGSITVVDSRRRAIATTGDTEFLAALDADPIVERVFTHGGLR